MQKAAISALLVFSAPLVLPASAIAQETAPAPEAAPAADPAPTPMTPEQITAFNQAVSDFTAGQTAQQSGDNAGALAKYEAALPAIRTAVAAEPGNADYVGFLANALYAAAAAQGGMQNFDGMLATFEEAAPLWRKVVAAKPADAASRNILAGILVQLGNARLGKQDKAGAAPLYAEALTLARQSVAAAPADAGSNNLLLSALIGSSQTSEDPKYREEAVSLGKKMMADGSIDASNKPSVEVLTGMKAG